MPFHKTDNHIQHLKALRDFEDDPHRYVNKDILNTEFIIKQAAEIIYGYSLIKNDLTLYDYFYSLVLTVSYLLNYYRV